MLYIKNNIIMCISQYFIVKIYFFYNKTSTLCTYITNHDIMQKRTDTIYSIAECNVAKIFNTNQQCFKFLNLQKTP